MTALLDCPLLAIDSGPSKGHKVRVRRSLTIGRHPSNDISIDDPSVSRKHAKIDVGDDGLKVLDAESGNGTYLNGTRVTFPTKLSAGDRIRVGQTVFVLMESDAR